MSGSGGDTSLLELFQEEVRANVQTLNDGLITLEQDPTNERLIEPLMRAAHSIKGAARVVSVDPAVTLAHAAEDCLVAAQEGRIALRSDDVDVLLRAVDALASIGQFAGPDLPQWLSQHRSELLELEGTLNTISRKTAGDAAIGAAKLEDAHVVPAEPADGGGPPPSAGSGGETSRTPVETSGHTPSAPPLTASPLLDLFRDEVRTNVQAINDGLAALERDASNLEAVESLARAVHSIKGAARVVNVDVAVKLADVLETCFVQAQKGQLVVGSDSVRTLLRGAGKLTEIGEAIGPEFASWLSVQAGEIDGLVEEIQILSGAKGGLKAEKPETSETPPTDSGPPRAPQTHPGLAEDKTTVSAKPPTAPSTAPRTPGGESVEQVVRVTAQSLTRLMGLAGESLVEARWLQPFSKSLLELKRQQAFLGDTLEELQQVLPPGDAHDRGNALLADATRRLAECRRILSDRISEFDIRARNADDLNSRLYHEVIASRMRPFRDGVQGFPRMVRDLARQMGKNVAFRVRGETTDVDRDILEKLEAPLNHILRNAVDHGLETPEERAAAGKVEACRLEVEARHSAGMLVITVSDDGRGIDLEKIRRKVIERQLADQRMAKDLSDSELLDFLFLPAFSTSENVTEVSGRGVGLDVVHSMVHSVGGSVRIHTQPGQGTSFRLELPITLSVIRAVLVRIAGEPYAFPHNRIDRLVRLPMSELHSLENRQHFEVDGRNVGIVLAHQVLDLEAGRPEGDDLFVILFSNHSHQYGLVVDAFCGERDLVVRPLDRRLGKVPNINAAAILDDGSPVLIVDLDDLRRSIERMLQSRPLRRADEDTVRSEKTQTKRILVVDDSITVREVQRQLLVNQGYEVEVAVDGMEGWNAVQQGQFDLIVTDIDMPRLNGIDLVRMIKEHPRFQRAPVVIVSYKDREEDRMRGLEAGADYYLTKSSFHDETLLGVVRDLIGDAGHEGGHR
jgi:two-component system sensor histidine kinase and response regulator WspE